MIKSRLVSYKTAVQRVSTILPNADFGLFEEWALIAIDRIGAYNLYEEAVDFLLVDGYQTFLPPGLIQIIQIAYMPESVGDSLDVDEIKSWIGEQASDEFAEQILNGVVPNERFKPLRLNNSSFASKIHCSNCVNYTTNCEHTYTVRANGCITTSFKSGIICMAYLRRPTNKNGEILIPDNEHLFEAIRAFCLFKYWERQMNSMVKGADRMMMYYQKQWNMAMQKAIAELSMPTIDQLESIKRMHENIIPSENHYRTFFKNLGQYEGLYLGGWYQRDSR